MLSSYEHIGGLRMDITFAIIKFAIEVTAKHC